ncbi:oxygen-independent coproporphyrinogen-III oxidase-like protein YqeR [Oxobacter pfennigii]|uniref:Heme chaperone HemW n=1 Tax=Oxobacter pfennigii TaxID=36849 RepID=A0A0N8NT85_9CLOT|nr:radical SAM family heme chaperone HemW [Oxobacter pfennigii]KPU44128.1 oxygen-independent coproporphyrinogen-III oxidase-like protein YqeR [Oxobacter pfennigii]
MKELGLYIHIPFCKSKCYYCDFNSYSGKESIQNEYIKCLIEETEKNLPLIKQYDIKSIYIGGGTPTYLNLDSLKMLLSYLKQFVSADIEYTLEANPGTLSEDKLKLMKRNGINRLSMGLQSFDDSLLKKIGRIHKSGDFIHNYNLARGLGFDNINMDLMFAIPGQSMDSFLNTLNEAIKLKPEHVSCYSLIIEEGTALYEDYKKGHIKETDEDNDRNMYHLAISKLKSAGYEQYEISNFSLPDFESRHNIIYWKCNEYLGLGAGAHSFINGTRFSNILKPEEYIKKINEGHSPRFEYNELTLRDRVQEFMFMGLRMNEGVSYDEFHERFKQDMKKVYGDKIKKLINSGLLKEEGRKISLTEFGRDVSNQVFVEFI